MLILSVRTDKPEAEIGLFNAHTKLDYLVWTAHRELAETIHLRLRALLETNGFDLHDLQGIVVYQGPGSFTGLRIGISVANALSDSLGLPIAAGMNKSWLRDAINKIEKGKNAVQVLPEYGSPPHITQPKH